MHFTPHTAADTQAMEDLVQHTFTASEGPSEGKLIGSLARSLLDTTASKDFFGFLALEGDQLIGIVFASRLFFQHALSSFIIAPVAVHPDHQGRGVGQALLRHSIKELRQQGVELLMTYGDPGYYCKVGFNPISPEDIQPPLKLSMPFGWIGQMLNGTELPTNSGRCECVEALADPRYW